MFYVDIDSGACANADKLRGWFPTREIAMAHIGSKPDDIGKEMFIIPGSFIVGVVERHPPEHLSKYVAAMLNDHNANIARMVPHAEDAFRYKPTEPEAIDDVQKAWIEKVKEANHSAYEKMLVTSFKIAFEAGMRAGEWQPFDTAPIDGSYFDAWVEPNNRTEKARRIPHVQFVENDGYFWADDEPLFSLGRPTHWRPEPEGPK